MSTPSARALVDLLGDPGSVTPWDTNVAEDQALGQTSPTQTYRTQLQASAARSGLDEAITTARVRVGGVPAALVVWEFRFLGGSLGVATAARLVAAVRRATQQGLPLLVVTRSGGTRMQEGTPAFIQMVAIAGAVGEHRRAGLPVLVHLGHPTTGGVLATIGSSGDLTTADPGGLVGFLGPRAVQAITGHGFSPGVQVTENLVRHGVVDGALNPSELREVWAGLLRIWRDRRGVVRSPRAEPGHLAANGMTAGLPTADDQPTHETTTDEPASAEHLWEAVQRSRQGLTAAKWVGDHVDLLVRLPGDGAGLSAGGALVGLGRLGGTAVVVLATVDDPEQPLSVGGLRTIARGIDMAHRWGLPILTVVDTLGAELSAPAEEAGITRDIARVMTSLVSAPVPTVGVLVGAGSGGAALALLAVDRVVAASHAWVAPLAPEGAAAIQHGAAGSPAQVAWDQQIGVHQLAHRGFVHHIVASTEADWQARVAQVAHAALHEARDADDRLSRYTAWRWSSGA